ncbi:2-isopropylmalate synthase [Hutsoniella sourekii]
MTKHIQFFDTTLRDGEQTPGVNFNTQEKIQLAKQLESWGIDVIEAGFPISSQGDFEAVQAIARELTTTRVCGLARCNRADIDRCHEALVDAKHKQIHVFIATSPIHREYKLNKSKQEILDSIQEHVTYAKTLFDHVQFSAEDATRTEPDFLAEACELAIQCGATIINIPDTVGYTNPSEYGQLFNYLQENVPSFDQAIFSCHCHDDLGLAVANSLAAIENGALRVEGTVNGIGERAGNAALEEVAVGLYIRRDHYQASTSINLGETKRTSDMVARLSGMAVPRNKAVVGANAYAHESGIHQDGVLKNPETYEIITPQLVGVKENALPLGKLSGRHAFISHLEELGYDTSEKEALSIAFNNFKDLADKKKTITETDLHAIMTGQNMEATSHYDLIKMQVQSIDENTHVATVAIVDHTGSQPQIKQDTAIGQGSVEAIFTTIEQLLGQEEVTLLEYRLDAVTDGIDSQAQVHVLVEMPKGQEVYAAGIDYDVLKASAKAYLQALERGSQHVKD